MRSVVFVSLAIVAVASVLVAAQILIICQNARKKSYDLKPFVRHLPHARLRFLFMGDSTAVGTGALSNTQSVAGFMAQDFPEASVDNDSYNGRKLEQLIKEFPAAAGPGYDLVVIQIGANDIMKFTPLGDIDRGITTVIEKAQRIGRHVVILHSGNVGIAPIFIWPFDWIMTQRSRAVRQIYMARVRQTGALYVDLFTERDDDLFLKDIPKYYCADRLHPSGEGYRWWYQRLRATLDAARVVLQ